MPIADVMNFIKEYRTWNPNASKQEVVAATVAEFRLTRHRAVYAGPEFAIRFSEASTPGFSNTVASLGRLREFDSVPFIVAIIRPSQTEFLLANSTFIKRISHSSQILATTRISGSFNGSDIAREYAGIGNHPENFERLFAVHQEFTWDENLERLVEATGQIAGRGRRFNPTPLQRDIVLRAPALAASLTDDSHYARLGQELAGIVAERSSQILEYGRIDSGNRRGNLIEQAITGGINAHNLADMVRHLAGRVEMQLEIKTKLMDRASSPKAYNVDKALEILARGGTAIAFCFVGVHLAAGRLTTSTISIFDRTVLAATGIQRHWAGRNSRGVTQLTGDFSRVFSPSYRETIDVEKAQQFLERLLNL